MTSEAIGIDSESLLFAKLKEYKNEISNLISRRQYNDRRKNTAYPKSTIMRNGGLRMDNQKSSAENHKFGGDNHHNEN